MKIRFMSNYDRMMNLMNIMSSLAKKPARKAVVENITPQSVVPEEAAKNICHELGKHIIVKKGNK